MEIKLGATAEVTITVTADRTADAMGNRGVKVLATPLSPSAIVHLLNRDRL